MFELWLRWRVFLGSIGCLWSLVSWLAIPVFCLVIILATVSAFKGNTIAFAGSATTTTSSPLVPHEINWTGKKNTAVVDAALSMTPYLKGNGSDQWYVAGFPQAALDYWASVCPAKLKCWDYWQEGDVQCAMFVGVTYHLAQQDLPTVPDAITFWSAYSNRQGWQEYANASQDPPIPGDIIVWENGGLGHVAIVVDVKLPSTTTDTGGSVTFAQANGPTSTEQETLAMEPNGHYLMETWPGYTVLGYIRHISSVS